MRALGVYKVQWELSGRRAVRGTWHEGFAALLLTVRQRLLSTSGRWRSTLGEFTHRCGPQVIFPACVAKIMVAAQGGESGTQFFIQTYIAANFLW